MWESEFADLNVDTNQAECPDEWHHNGVIDRPCPECGEKVQFAYTWIDPTMEETR